MKNHFEKMKGQGGFSGLLQVKCSDQTLPDRFTYLSIDNSEEDTQVFKIMGVVPLSKIFSDFNGLKNKGDIEDFSYYEPSLHHAFVAISQNN